jgi:hypothetical protein
MKILNVIIFIGVLYADSSDSLLKASAALNAGMFEEALIHVSEAQKQEPTNPDVHQLKALLHEALDEPEKNNFNSLTPIVFMLVRIRKSRSAIKI